ncbi:MAG TPA: hypothetical protein VK190_09245 [Pseudoneobacillus sp.]|nr:hypothetical protein [Pseudoneobacillus sp.]
MPNTFNNAGLGLAITTTNMENSDTKLSEDRYEIYVNNDFVGYKALHNVTDTLEDIDDFLKSQGINEFQSKLDGDHYHINGNENGKIKDILNVYCQNR